MKFTLRGVLNNRKLLWLISLGIAIIAWFVVSVVIDPDTTQLVEDITVNINTQASTISKLELHEIGGGQTTVDVYIKGSRLVVGGIKEGDITITASLAPVTGPGVFDLPLQATNSSGEEFEIISFSPSVISVKFDRLQTKKMPIEVLIDGLKVPDGYMVEKESVTPGEVTLSGPEIDINKVAKCVVSVSVGETLTKPTVVQAELTLLDKDGNKVDSQYITKDVDTVDVAIPVKKIVELPLKVDFVNVPTGFPIEELSYTLSNATIVVAGTPDVISNYSEIHLGYIDLKQLDFEKDYTFDVELPSGFVNINNIATVFVEFNDIGMSENLFTVTNFVLKNRPANFDVSVTTTRLTNVRIVGDKDIIDKLTASDIVAEIDMSNRAVQAGQYNVPINVYLPTQGLVWALGDYSAVISVKEKQ